MTYACMHTHIHIYIHKIYMLLLPSSDYSFRMEGLFRYNSSKRIPLPMQETEVQSLGQEDLWEPRQPNSEFLMENPWIENGRIQSMGLQKSWHNLWLNNNKCVYSHIYIVYIHIHTYTIKYCSIITQATTWVKL